MNYKLWEAGGIQKFKNAKRQWIAGVLWTLGIEWASWWRIRRNRSQGGAPLIPWLLFVAWVMCIVLPKWCCCDWEQLLWAEWKWKSPKVLFAVDHEWRIIMIIMILLKLTTALLSKKRAKDKKNFSKPPFPKFSWYSATNPVVGWKIWCLQTQMYVILLHFCKRFC